jgi:N6-L-threonylcarbamoyladenine synthase
MKLLSIETSCDDTGITIMDVKGGATNATFKVLANNLSSQVKVHIPFGGVYPMLAKREHIKNLPIVLEKTLREAEILQERGLGSATARARGIFQQKNIRAESVRNLGLDAIAVTFGPGLEPSLWAGITFAKELAANWKVPLIPVNHMEGHVLSVFGKTAGTFKISKLKNPTLTLLVSGGHTQLVLSRKFMKYEIIGESLDDAVGEAFDKVARMLGLPYPGGPQISKLAQTVKSSRFKFPRPMLKSKNFDFSFSGLKTAVLYTIQKLPKLDDKIKAEIAYEFEQAAIECLVYKTQKALEKYKIKTLTVSGGVAANKYLREEIQKKVGKKIKLLLCPRELTGDNSLMIGIAGYLNFIKNKKKVPKPETIKATGNLRL